jgi:hypothetical protein
LVVWEVAVLFFELDYCCCFFKGVAQGRLGGMACLPIDVLALFPLSFVLCVLSFMLCTCLYKFKKDRDSFFTE